MNDRALQVALREWRLHMGHHATLVALGATSAVLTLAGPFQTGGTLAWGPRALYWICLVFGSYSMGYLIDALIRCRAGASLQRRIVFSAAIVTGAVIAMFVLILNALSLGYIPTLPQLPEALGVPFLIGVLVTLAISTVSSTLTPNISQPPPLLNRLPMEKRAPLVALTVEDHYVRVQTTKGSEMLLMRLSDAIGEVGDTPGTQVHRSHWISFAQVKSARKEGDRAILTMSHGPEIPVSRANRAKIQEAGLLLGRK